MPRIILASQSPRRRQLLAQMGIAQFDVLVPEADESFDETLSPEEIVCSICRKKAQAARLLAEDEDAVIISADTMVFLEDRRLGKPRSEEEAAQMLRTLSGKMHHVYTGVTVCRGGEFLTEAERTTVRFAPLTEEDISAYVATGEPMDKAGSYGIQGPMGAFIPEICGDYFNVMGLPLYRLSRMLGHFGVSLWNREERE